MKKLLLISLLLLHFFSFSQKSDSKGKERYAVGLLPSSSANIYGLAIGFMGSEVVCNRYYIKKSHGINVQLLGQGFFTPFYVFNKQFNYSKTEIDTIIYGDSTAIKRVVHNGLLFAVFGTFSEDINGVSISPWMSLNHRVNGLTLNVLVNSSHTLNGVAIGLYNSTYRTKGLQLGLFNQTNHLKGFQFGIWNVNNKRKLPLVNWSFKD